jgi:predicted site-specific integrase-resolvase
MNLVTPKEAAKASYVTLGMIAYWIRKGRVKKHYVLDSTWRYLVDLDEIKKASKGMEGMKADAPPNLITREEAAQLIWTSKGSIGYYVRMGYLKRYYVLGNRYHYLVDRDEVISQIGLMQERNDSRKPLLSKKAKLQNRSGGKFAKS